MPSSATPPTTLTWCTARGTWKALAGVYAEFVECYQPVLEQLRAEGQAEIDGESAFLLRILLIHDYRRLLLRDPELPDVLLPADWPGQKARLLCKELYRRLLAPSERHLDAHFQLASGQPRPPRHALHERFREDDPLGMPA
jgi:phenylacetic acid degradation operon negative regulatory protein